MLPGARAPPSSLPPAATGNFTISVQGASGALSLRGRIPLPPSALTVVQLAAVPLAIGAVTPSAVSAAGGATLTIRGSGFQNSIAVTINGKAATVTFKDASTLLVVTPSLTPGSQQLTLANPDGETVSVDAALIAN